MEEDYFIFFSGEGERSRVERRVKKRAGDSEEIGTIVSVEYKVIPQIVVMELMFLRRIHETTKEELERLMMREL